ncbi:MAG: hypothetical protein JJE04_14335 [Acidobacteriia bacterium]|nr:hypothetical protein [Terriglobia bacterium]
MTGHEKTDANVASISGFLAGLFALIAISMAAMWGLFLFLAKTDRPETPATPMEVRRVIPPAPRLQIGNSEDLAALRARQLQAISSYGWVDKSAGIVRIPVERAMDLVAERGLTPAKSAREAKK